MTDSEFPENWEERREKLRGGEDKTNYGLRLVRRERTVST